MLCGSSRKVFCKSQVLKNHLMQKIYWSTLVLTAILCGCGIPQKSGQKPGIDSQEPIHNEALEEAAHHNEIFFPEDQAESAWFTLDTVQPSVFYEIIPATGQLLSAPGDEFTLAAPVSGIVSGRVEAWGEGIPVKAGEILFTLSSKNISEGDYNVRVLAAYEKARTEYERISALVVDKIVSQKEYEQAKRDYETEKASYEALSRYRNESGTGVSVPGSGYIRKILVREGEYVQMGQLLAVLTQHKKLRLRAEVPERYYDRLSGISGAGFTTPYNQKVYEISSLNGQLLSVGKSPAENSVYIPVNFELDAAEGLIPESFVEVYLRGEPASGVITVPVTALIEEQGQYSVFVRLEKDLYQKRTIRKGAEDGIRALILSGLRPGEIFVSRGAYQVKLASVSESIPEGDSHAH